MILAVILEWAQGLVFPVGAVILGIWSADFWAVLAGFAFRALYLMWPMGKKPID